MRIQATYQIAMAAGRDAGNQLMLERSLKAWDDECWAAATAAFNCIYG